MIGELAAAQWGVVARRQLLAAGVSGTTIDRRVARGRLLPLHRGVYAVGHARLRREGWWLAAVLAVGPGAVLSHRDAAGLHDLRPANHRRVDVTTRARGREQRQGIRVHPARSLDAEDVATVNGIPVTTVARTLVDLAGAVPADHVAKAIRSADERNLLDATALEAVLRRTRGRRGQAHQATREAIAKHQALAGTLTRSSLEVAFQRLIARAGLRRPQTNVQLQGLEVDAHWPAAKLVVELDGWQHHRTRHAFQRDRERDAALTAAGYKVIRFTHNHVTARPDHVIETLRRLGVR